MKPSPTLCSRTKTRIAFTTKQVGGGFYRGNRTGSLGAHTKHGNYIIDWRKVRHYVMPDLKNFKLTPFVGRDVYADDKLHVDDDNVPYDARKFSGLHYLKYWKDINYTEYQYWADSRRAREGNAEDNEQTQEQEPEQHHIEPLSDAQQPTVSR